METDRNDDHSHQFLWLCMQLHRGREATGAFMNFRLIHDEAPVHHPDTGRLMTPKHAILNKNVPIAEVRNTWLTSGGMFDQFFNLNHDPSQPANVYFGINLRNHATLNRKENILGFCAFYLDLDVTANEDDPTEVKRKNYTYNDRLAQIAFLRDHGFDPTTVINSGHGLQAYWAFNEIVPQEVGEPILKQMVHKTGCEVKGNTWDVARIFRAPGFRNVKHWYNSDTPACFICYPSPADVQKSWDEKTLRTRYSIEQFTQFPLCRKEDIASYTQQAELMSGPFYENLQLIVKATVEQKKNVEVQQAAATIAAGQAPKEQEIKKAVEEALYTPTINSAPPDLKDIQWGRGNTRWAASYATRGFDGLTQAELDAIKEKFNVSSISGSELDAKIVYYLIRAGYTFKAVDELWRRPGLRLYREEKFNSNPNYLQMTYDKMLEAYRGTLAKTAVPSEISAAGDRIFIHENQMYIRTTSNVRSVVSAVLELEAVYTHKDADEESKAEFYMLCITSDDSANPGQTVSRRQLIPRYAFGRVDIFNKFCAGDLICLTDSNADLRHLLQHIRKRMPKAKKHSFHSRMVFSDDTFIFPKLTINANEVKANTSFELIGNLKASFPWHDEFISELPNEDEARKTLEDHFFNAMNMHSPELFLTVFGLITATFERSILAHKGVTSSLHLPIVNVRGTSHSGKSETVRILYKFTGAVNPENASTGIRSTAFAQGRMMELVRTVPILYDEFKEEKSKDNEKFLTQIRDLVRRCYSGEQDLRGRADLTVNSARTHGSLIILGETQVNRIGNISEATRIIGVNTDGFKPAISSKSFYAIQAAKFYLVTPFFLQWLIQQDHNALWAKFQDLRNAWIAKLEKEVPSESGRVGHNLAAIEWGCFLFDSFIETWAPNVKKINQNFHIQNVMYRHTLEGLQNDSQVITITNSANVTHKISRNEALDFLSDLSQSICMKTHPVREKEIGNVFYYEEDEDNDELRIQLTRAHDVYVESLQKLGKLFHTLSTIRHRLTGAMTRKDIWIVENIKVMRIKSNNSQPHRCATFKLSILREMEIWHAKEVAQEVSPEQKLFKRSRNRISGDNKGVDPNALGASDLFN